MKNKIFIASLSISLSCHAPISKATLIEELLYGGVNKLDPYFVAPLVEHSPKTLQVMPVTFSMDENHEELLSQFNEDYHNLATLFQNAYEHSVGAGAEYVVPVALLERFLLPENLELTIALDRWSQLPIVDSENDSFNLNHDFFEFALFGINNFKALGVGSSELLDILDYIFKKDVNIREKLLMMAGKHYKAFMKVKNNDLLSKNIFKFLGLSWNGLVSDEILIDAVIECVLAFGEYDDYGSIFNKVLEALGSRKLITSDGSYPEVARSLLKVLEENFQGKPPYDYESLVYGFITLLERNYLLLVEWENFQPPIDMDVNQFQSRAVLEYLQMEASRDIDIKPILKILLEWPNLLPAVNEIAKKGGCSALEKLFSINDLEALIKEINQISRFWFVYEIQPGEMYRKRVMLRTEYERMEEQVFHQWVEKEAAKTLLNAGERRLELLRVIYSQPLDIKQAMLENAITVAFFENTFLLEWLQQYSPDYSGLFSSGSFSFRASDVVFSLLSTLSKMSEPHSICRQVVFLHTVTDLYATSVDKREDFIAAGTFPVIESALSRKLKQVLAINTVSESMLQTILTLVLRYPVRMQAMMNPSTITITPNYRSANAGARIINGSKRSIYTTLNLLIPLILHQPVLAHALISSIRTDDQLGGVLSVLQKLQLEQVSTLSPQQVMVIYWLCMNPRAIEDQSSAESLPSFEHLMQNCLQDSIYLPNISGYLIAMVNLVNPQDMTEKQLLEALTNHLQQQQGLQRGRSFNIPNINFTF